jgi:hypothetical protein
MMIVAPASTKIDGYALEVRIGAREGLPFEGVLRVALPRPVASIPDFRFGRGTFTHPISRHALIFAGSA